MFAPIAPLKRAASKARSTLRDSIDATEHLREQVAGETDETEPEDLEPSQAQHKLQDEYEPLMSRGNGGRAGSVSSRASSILSVLTDGGGQASQVKTRKLEIAIAYVIFFILGACILLPWNALIVANTYFHSRLIGSPFEASFASWVALGFCTSNLVFLAIATFTQTNNMIGKRITFSIILMTVVFAFLIATTRFESMSTGLFFGLLILSTATLAVAASYLQNAVVALSSRFGPIYLQGILSGQGAIALIVALIQFFAAYSALSAQQQQQQYGQSPFWIRANPPIPEKGRNAAFAFFLTVAIFAIVSLCSLGLLVKLPMYRLVIRSGSPVATPEQEDDDDASSYHMKKEPSLWQVERKVRHLGIAILYVFLVTLSVFPSITSSILSVHDPKTSPLGRLSSTELWVPAVFCLFALGDWIGRALPQWEKLAFKNWKALALSSALRTVFIPLFLMCNVQTGFDNVKKPVLGSDTIFLLLMLVFAVSNGYVSTLIMLAAVVEPSLEEEEIDIAATCLAFYLTAGLALGSFISFPVRAAVCQCNPFS